MVHIHFFYNKKKNKNPKPSGKDGMPKPTKK